MIHVPEGEVLPMMYRCKLCSWSSTGQRNVQSHTRIYGHNVFSATYHEVVENVHDLEKALTRLDPETPLKFYTEEAGNIAIAKILLTAGNDGDELIFSAVWN